VTADEVIEIPELADLYDELDDVLVRLRLRQINALNLVIRAHGRRGAPNMREQDESPRFVVGEALPLATGRVQRDTG